MKDAGRWQPSVGQGERSQKKLTLPTPWSWTSSLQNCENINFYLVSHSVCNILLWQPRQTTIESIASGSSSPFCNYITFFLKQSIFQTRALLYLDTSMEITKLVKICFLIKDVHSVNEAILPSFPVVPNPVIMLLNISQSQPWVLPFSLFQCTKKSFQRLSIFSKCFESV